MLVERGELGAFVSSSSLEEPYACSAACSSWSFNIPTPITTKNPVQNLPKSIMPFPELSMKSSGLEHLPQIQFGKGAIT